MQACRLTALCPQSLGGGGGGVVPYLGTYLTVLTMLDTALTDTVEVNTLALKPFTLLLIF